MNIVWFNQETTIEDAGGKGHALARMSQAGLPVPHGFCVTARGLENPGILELQPALSDLRSGAFAVRSSSPLEDGATASFAGMYLTRLNVMTTQGVIEALREIRESVLSPAATCYLQRHNLTGYRRMAAVVQAFLPADTSGVLFMRDPADGSRRIIVEGTWGLGEAVVGGLVQPDRWILSLEGNVISSNIADKDAAIVPEENGGTKQIKVEAARRRHPCLSLESLQKLVALAKNCERLFDAPQDIEWAVASDCVWLLQSRPITAC